MKTKLCWIPFIPALLAMAFVKYIEVTLPQGGTFMGFDKTALVYFPIIVVPALYIVCILISLFDKKISRVYALGKNPFAALFMFLAGIGVIASSAMHIMDAVSTGNFAVLSFITSIVGVFAALAMVFMASCHLNGRNCGPALSVYMLLPVIWAGFKLGVSFQSFTTVSVISADLLDLLCYSLIALFLYSDAMVICCIQGKNTVKRCFVRGLAMIAAVFTSSVKSVYSIAVNFDAYDVPTMIDTAVMLCIGIYALAVLIEFSAKVKTKDMVQELNETDQLDDYARASVREEVAFLYEDENGNTVPNIITGNPAADGAGNGALQNNPYDVVLNIPEDDEKSVIDTQIVAEEHSAESGAAAGVTTGASVPGNGDFLAVEQEPETDRNTDSEYLGGDSPQKPDEVKQTDVETVSVVEETADVPTTQKETVVDASDRIKERMDEIDRLILEIQSDDN